MISNIAKTLGASLYFVQVTDCYAWTGQRLEVILEDISKVIGADPLCVAHHDFEPHGSSAVMMISESHMAIHTYPYIGSSKTLRVDVDISGCGSLQPLIVLDYLLHFNPEVMTVDYKLRGYNDNKGKEWPDLPGISILDFVHPLVLVDYETDSRTLNDSTFAAKLMRCGIEGEVACKEASEIMLGHKLR